jgi:hypothetical protein
MDENLEAILADEELKAMHLLDYQFFSEDRKKFPSNAAALVYHFNTEVRPPRYRYMLASPRALGSFVVHTC